MNNSAKTLIATMVAAAAAPTNAMLILSFSGTNGSSVVNYSATGTYTVPSNTTAFGSASPVLRMPVAGVWDSAVDDNIGDAILNSATSLNNLVLSNGGITFQLDAVTLGTFDQLDLSATATAGGDDIRVDPAVSITYPAATAGQTVSWTGAGTFTLTGFTYDTYFIPGTYSAAGYSSVVQFDIAASAIPEPSTYIAMAGFIGLGAFSLWRRRGKRTKD